MGCSSGTVLRRRETCTTSREWPGWLRGLIYIYIFLSFFETYLYGFIGSATKYFVLLIVIIVLSRADWKILLNACSILFISWFLLKLVSIMWSNGANADVSTHFVSQVGNLIFLVVLTGQRRQDGKILYRILRVYYGCSALFGVLSLYFNSAFISEDFKARQVLTLFGQQNDPNNCAAYLLVGIAWGSYAIITSSEKRLLNLLIVGINIYALILTSSRAGFVILGVVIIFITLAPQGKGISLTKRLLILACVVALVMAVVLTAVPQDSLGRLLAFDEYKEGSGRAIRWELALELVKQRPIFGWGWGGYRVGTGMAIHNTILTSLCDVGIVGTILLFMPSVLIFVDSIKKKAYAATLLLIVGVMPGIFIDAINKRFFWNALIFSIMILQYSKQKRETQGIESVEMVEK